MNIPHLCELILLKLDGQQSEEQLRELDELLRNNRVAQDLFIDITAICCGLAEDEKISVTLPINTNESERSPSNLPYLEAFPVDRQRSECQLVHAL